jgi:hypothetical protein
MTVIPVVILMIPVPFMQLPPLPVVIIVRMIPICPFIGRTVPPPSYPPIMMPMRGPVTVDPGIARTWLRPALLVPVRRWCASDVHANLSRSRDGENGCEHNATYPIQFHFVSPIDYYLTTVEYFGGTLEKLLPYLGLMLRLTLRNLSGE